MTMTTEQGETGRCPQCGVEWALVNRHWTWKERSGALHNRPLLASEIDEDGQPKRLTHCPHCLRKLPEAVPPPSLAKPKKDRQVSPAGENRRPKKTKTTGSSPIPRIGK